MTKSTIAITFESTRNNNRNHVTTALKFVTIFLLALIHEIMAITV